MKKLFILTLISSFFISCGEHEEIIFDPNSGATLAFWKVNTLNFGVPIDSQLTLDIQVGVTTLSAENRTVSVEVVEQGTDLPAANFTLPTSFTIPANEYFGTLSLIGIDDENLGTDAKSLILKLVSISDGGKVSSQLLNISVRQICPIPADKFVGNYLLTEITPFVDGPTLDHGQVREVFRVSETERRISTRNYPNYCTPFRDFFFNLVCNNVVVPANQRSTCQCSASGLFFGPAAVPATYDVDNDAEFFVTFTNDVTNNCGAPVQTTYRFNKQ
ncbi:MAG: hypothetical protein ACK4JX_05190 [Flavobacterium sp.]